MRSNLMANSDGHYNVVDLFAGVGGLAMGFEENGFETLFANDFDEYAAETYKFNHKNTPFIDGDVSKITEEQIRKIIGDKEVDLVVGGIPCQS